MHKSLGAAGVALVALEDVHRQIREGLLEQNTGVESGRTTTNADHLHGLLLRLARVNAGHLPGSDDPASAVKSQWCDAIEEKTTADIGAGRWRRNFSSRHFII